MFRSSSTLAAFLFLPLLLLSAVNAESLLAVRGQLTFFNDSGSFLLDVAQTGEAGHSLGGKLAAVSLKPGAGAFVMGNIPTGAIATFTVLKKGAYPEGTLQVGGRDIGQWLVSKSLATPLPR